MTAAHNPEAPTADIAQVIAETYMRGFNRHYRIFRETSRRAHHLFETADWQGMLAATRERVQYYDDRVAETVRYLRQKHDVEKLDPDTWQRIKLYYVGLLVNHRQPELAETFFNSVTTKILHRSYFNNDHLFARPAASTEYIESNPPVYTSYYPGETGFRGTLVQILRDFAWAVPFANLRRDIRNVHRAVREYFQHQLGCWPKVEVNCQLQVLHSAFYRNKIAYIIGKLINGNREHPFAIAVLHGDDHRLRIDTVLLDPALISVMFSLSRAYFMAEMEVPSGYVQFLRSIMPNKPRSELYTMLGLGKQGKTTFFRDLLAHLRHSNDRFIIAPGIRGLVMLVFTLPSYPYVFKIIKDVFGSSKNMDHATVRRKYLMVKHVDRVGRMADTLEFSHAALPLARFHPELIEELQKLAPSVIDIEGDNLIIKHLYIERRMTPLNIYIDQADDTEMERVVRDYGNAIRELATANIFPGDMLWKNFGVTRYGRIVFYDYDEIEYMTDMNFRRIPPAPNPEMEMSGEPWYSAAPNDVFPEEFATFLLSSPRVRKAFLKYHRDLLDVTFWQNAQQSIRKGHVEDFFAYPPELRFCNRYSASA